MDLILSLAEALALALRQREHYNPVGRPAGCARAARSEKLVDKLCATASRAPVPYLMNTLTLTLTDPDSDPL